MKKKICIVIVGILIASFTGLNLYHSQKEMIMSDVVIANVEALASGESSGIPWEGFLYDPSNKCCKRHNPYAYCDKSDTPC